MRDRWLGALLLSAASAAGAQEAPEKKPAVPLYTNADLDRVAPFRDQTGVDSVPGHAAEPAPTHKAAKAGDGVSSARGRGESYWRKEAEKVRQQIRKLAAQAATLRSRIEAERARPQRSKSRSPKPGSDLEARLEALRLEARTLDDDLADRARRDGALPGWLR